MIDESLCFLSLHELGDQIRRRKMSPVEVVNTYIERCDRLNSTLNAFITLTPDFAIMEAKRAEHEIIAGLYRGPLHGIPIGVKDIFDTENIRTTYGSSFFRDHVPKKDAAPVKLLKQAGAIIIGKCNTHEFAAGSTTNNPWYGPSHNPWNLSRSPGGSSGGSGAAVAAHLCPGATGTDTGGSIRNPASCNGIVGLKPTYGRVSLLGVHPLAPSLDHVGPLCRSAQDAGLLLQGMSGYVKEDYTSAKLTVPDFNAEIFEGVKNMRIAFCPDLHFCELDNAVEVALLKAGHKLQELGAHLINLSFPLKDIFQKTRENLYWAEFSALHRSRYKQFPEGYGEDLKEQLETHSHVTTDEYVQACYDRLALRRTFDHIFEEVDALLLPSSPCVAPFISDGTSLINGKIVKFGEVGLPLRQPINVVGLPSISVPIGFSDGLPIAMQIVGPAWCESKIIRICHAYEDATPKLRNLKPLN